MSRGRRYRCSPSIVWVKDADQTLVADRKTERSWAFRDVEAVVWDLLVVGYSYQRIVRMLSLILALPTADVERTLTGVLREWQDSGIVQVSGGTGGG